MTAAYFELTTADVRMVHLGPAFDTALQSPDDPAWAVVAARHTQDLAAEAADLHLRMAQGEGIPLRLVDFRKHMK